MGEVISGPDPVRHVDLDVEAQVAGMLGDVSRTVELRGPVAHVGRATDDGRRLDALVPSGRPMPVRTVDGFAVGHLTGVEQVDGVVWMSGRMKTSAPLGTRFPVAADVAVDASEDRDQSGRVLDPVDAWLAGELVTVMSGRLVGVTLGGEAWWPDMYLEVVADCITPPEV